MLQDNVLTLPSDNTDIPKPFSFQVIEKIILDYPNKVTSQQGEVASKDNRHLSDDISGSTPRKKPNQIIEDVILRIVSPMKGDTDKKKGKSIRQYLCSSSKNHTKNDDNISDGQNEHDLAVIKDNPKV
jgi:hypothetical protein